MIVGRKMWRASFAFVLLVALFFLGAANALHAQPTPPPYDPETVPPPASMPNAAIGGGLYLENCAPCHGDTGGGDGPTAPDLSAPPSVFADPAVVWGRSPAEFFHTTKFGRMQNMMPPWRNQMTDDQIWDAVYYAWGLHTSQIEIQAGDEIYVQECAACHGESGAGDGPDAEGELPDLSDGARMMLVSPAAMSQSWNDAHPELGAELSAQERTSVINYVRTFTYVPPWESPFRDGEGVIEGSILLGSSLDDRVAGVDVLLRAFINFAEVATFEAVTDENGGFRFDELATGETVVYAVEAAYNDVRYGSDFIRIDPESNLQQVEIAVYDASDDDSGVRMARTNWVIDFAPGALNIGQIMTFGNESESSFTGKTIPEVDVPVTVAFKVPPNAENIEFRDGVLGVDYFQIGDTIYDTASLIPGEATRQIVVSYQLPLDGDVGAMVQDYLYPVEEINLLVADFDGLEVTVDGLEFDQIETIQGLDYRIWSRGEMPPGESIAVEVSGALSLDDVDPRAFVAEQQDTGIEQVGSAQTADPLEPYVPVAVGGLMAVALGGVFIWSVRSGSGNDSRRSLADQKNELVNQIAVLDDQHEHGEIDTGEWTRQRADLKRELLAVATQINQERP
jgi:mono/diheme cytochrome c family protein